MNDDGMKPSIPDDAPARPLPLPHVTVGDKHVRSVVKGISWRAVGTLDTMIISYLITGNVKYAAFIGSTEAMTKVVLFWAHERVWQKIKWGRILPTTSSP